MGKRKTRPHTNCPQPFQNHSGQLNASARCRRHRSLLLESAACRELTGLNKEKEDEEERGWAPTLDLSIVYRKTDCAAQPLGVACGAASARGCTGTNKLVSFPPADVEPTQMIQTLQGDIDSLAV